MQFQRFGNYRHGQQRMRSGTQRVSYSSGIAGVVAGVVGAGMSLAAAVWSQVLSVAQTIPLSGVIPDERTGLGTSRDFKDTYVYEFDGVDDLVRVTLADAGVLNVTYYSLASSAYIATTVSHSGTGYDIALSGKVTNIKLWSSAPTDENRDAVEYATVPASLLAWFKADEEAGAIAYDSSGNENHGTITNASTDFGAGFHVVDNTAPYNWKNEVGFSDSVPDLTNGGFDDTSAWILGDGWAITSGVCRRTASASSSFVQAYPLNGLEYVLTFTISNRTVGFVQGRMSDNDAGSGSAVSSSNISTNGTHSVTLRASDTNAFVGIFANATFDGDIDNMSIALVARSIPRDESVPTLDVLGNALTYSGVAANPGQVINSPCGTFDGTDDHVVVPNTARFISATMSFGGWFDVTSSDNHGFVGKGVNNQWLLMQEGTQLRLRVLIGDLWVLITPYIGRRHIVGVVDGTSGSIYIDGVLVTSGTIPAMPSDNGDDIHIGVLRTTTYPYDGTAFDVRVYDKPLTADEIQNWYTSGTSGTDPTTDNLVARWPFSENSGPTVHDVSGNGNHGTWMNATTTEGAGAWANKQDLFHWSIAKGFSVDPLTGAEVPAKEDGTADALGGSITNPARVGHNGACSDFRLSDGEWSFNDARTNPGFKRNRTAGGATVAVDRFMTAKEVLTGDALTAAEAYTADLEE